jgi:hypothetical protein
MIEFLHDLFNLAISYIFKATAFGKVLPDQAIGIFVQPSLPRILDSTHKLILFDKKLKFKKHQSIALLNSKGSVLNYCFWMESEAIEFFALTQFSRRYTQRLNKLSYRLGSRYPGLCMVKIYIYAA